ncbi:hypothetical protein F2Q70_00010085 [Brassica cretica]|uniref:HAT C-terminal dimerisation domain-containing protein n=1 Tax=Brassica cretica TaxID=69181 RepID=A0A8S9M547_BRACR|nr:hypothetical protein F2Q70_00010085 [Brassica cretica]
MDNSDLASDSDMVKNQNLDDSEYDFEDDDEEEETDVHNAMPYWLQINPVTIRKEILKIYETQKIKAKKFLKDFQGKLTLSYEWILSGNESTRDFVCLTAHFIDDNWTVRHWILGFLTGALIPLDDIYVYHFRKAVQDFEIENKVSTILLPNRYGFDEKNVDAIRKCMDRSVNKPVFVVYCCSDLFRLMVNDMYNEFSWHLYEDVRMLVGWGSLSSTNWNVRLYHLQQAVDMQKEDAFSKDEIYDDYDKPSDEEWVKIRTFCRLAGVIHKVAEEVFEGGYSTSNVYFHLLAELKVMLKREVDSGGGDYFVGKGEKVLKLLDKYWNDMFLVLAAASVLDPRFKMNYIDFYCSKKVDSDEGSKAEAVLDYLRDVYARYAAKGIYHKPICPVATVDYEEEEDDDEDYGGCSREFQESELDSYLKEPVLEWNKDFKALEWWREESQKYPILSRVARDILSIPISQAGYRSYQFDVDGRIVVYCCADLFRLMINDLYSEFSWSLYENVRMLVGWGRLSSTNWNVRLYHLQQAVGMQKEDAFSKDEVYDDYDKPSDEEWVKIRTFCRLAANDIFRKPICPVDYEEEDADDEEEEEDKEENKPDAYEDFVLFKEYLKFEGGRSREFQESELDSYLKEPVMEWNKDFKALEWWKEESQKYPILSRVAPDILSIPISRATSYDAYVSEIREPPGYVLSMDAKAANAMDHRITWIKRGKAKGFTIRSSKTGSVEMKKGNVEFMASRIAKGVKKNQSNGAGLDDVSKRDLLIG